MDSGETLDEAETVAPEKEGVLGLLWVHPEEGFSPLVDGMMSLGRDASSSVTLPSSSVSRKHAIIRRQGALYTLSDQGSRNGTFRNGVRVSDAPLSRGDIVRLGSWVAVVAVLPPEVARSQAYFAEPREGVIIGPHSITTWNTIERFAPTDVPILLQGETGTGKEVVARAIHDLSGRDGAFLAQNCGALPSNLAEAQLFGYQRGAFTGATQASAGLFAAADGGTLLLDEVTDLPLEQQVKLLRVLEEKVVVPLGSTTGRPVQVRIVAAAQQSLADVVERQRFRADLHARLAGVTISLLPLRERREEVPRLFTHFVGTRDRLRASFIEALLLYDWPRNIREVKLVAERAAIELAELDQWGAAHFRRLVSAEPRSAPAARREKEPSSGVNRALWERDDLTSLLGRRRTAWLLKHQQILEELQAAMVHTGGNVSSAAQHLGISRQKAQRILLTIEQLQESSAMEGSQRRNGSNE